MFVQADTSLERSVSGLGIGLTLAKNLVQLHGGTLEAHSGGIGKGSAFTVRLPVATEAPALSKPTVNRPIARRILVVDDNRDSATSLAMLLNLTGNETRTAYDGVEALEKAAEFLPDVILLDIGLPKMNGYDACRCIRDTAWGDRMKVVALTGWGQEEDRLLAKNAGFNGHIVKPVDQAALTSLLAELDGTVA